MRAFVIVESAKEFMGTSKNLFCEYLRNLRENISR